MREILEIVFKSSMQRIELVKEQNGLFGIIKIVDGQNFPLYANRDLEPVQKFYNKIVGA